MPKEKIAFLLTCHNRRDKTIQCLENLFQQNIGYLDKKVFLVDDGSTDGTADAVVKNFPDVKVLKGDGSLFWNRGMGYAFSEAIHVGFDYYVWLNDDTFLYPGAMDMLLKSYSSLSKSGKGKSIVVGSTKDPANDYTTYGGFVQKSKINPISGSLINPSGQLQKCDKIVGNCVLIPAVVVKEVGNLDLSFRHRFGDVDYGYRARKSGCTLWVAPDYIGTCEDNPYSEKWKDKSLTLKVRLKHLRSVRGLPIKDWTRYLRRHGGPLWWLIWFSPYLKIFSTSLKKKKDITVDTVS